MKFEGGLGAKDNGGDSDVALCGGAFGVKETEVGAFTWRDAFEEREEESC